MRPTTPPNWLRGISPAFEWRFPTHPARRSKSRARIATRALPHWVVTRKFVAHALMRAASTLMSTLEAFVTPGSRRVSTRHAGGACRKSEFPQLSIAITSAPGHEILGSKKSKIVHSGRLGVRAPQDGATLPLRAFDEPRLGSPKSFRRVSPGRLAAYRILLVAETLSQRKEMPMSPLSVDPVASTYTVHHVHQKWCSFTKKV